MAIVEKTFERFDDIADGNIVLVLSYLNDIELAYASLMSLRISTLSQMNELWLPLCMASWQNHHRFEEWIDSIEKNPKAHFFNYITPEHRNNPQPAEYFSTSDKVLRIMEAHNSPSYDNREVCIEKTFWREQFLEKREQLHYEICIFAMGGIRPEIGSSFHLHLFEPRYRWLAARCQDLPQCDRYICFIPHIPIYSIEKSVGLICKVTDLEINHDGRANITLLPVVYCKFDRVWFEQVPNQGTVPSLYCAKVKEFSIERQGATLLGSSGIGNDLFLNGGFSWRSILVIVVAVIAVLLKLTYKIDGQ